jgi:hypothetical protein
MEEKQIQRTNWANQHFIEIEVKDGWSTYDSSDLTWLLVLCHELALRVEIFAPKQRYAKPPYLRLLFTQRDRRGDLFSRHPTIEEAVVNVRKYAGR